MGGQHDYLFRKQDFLPMSKELLCHPLLLVLFWAECQNQLKFDEAAPGVEK